jgi:hypothetical protein
VCLTIGKTRTVFSNVRIVHEMLSSQSKVNPHDKTLWRRGKQKVSKRALNKREMVLCDISSSLQCLTRENSLFLFFRLLCGLESNDHFL